VLDGFVVALALPRFDPRPLDRQPVMREPVFREEREVLRVAGAEAVAVP
jgi:hypothetical protein